MALEDAKKQVDTAITRDGFKGGLSFENTFGGVTSFLRRTLTKDLTGVDLAVTGIPFDQAVTNRPPGTRLVRARSARPPPCNRPTRPMVGGALTRCPNSPSPTMATWPSTMPCGRVPGSA